MTERRVVTFDLFSALIDSRTGGSAAVGAELYDAWDPRNKAEQGRSTAWVPWRETATRAMAAAYDALGLDGSPTEAVEALVSSLPDWPLWPDVAEGLPLLAEQARVGLLSNVDDDLFARTAAATLVDPAVALTSQRLGVAKPHPEIYTRAVERHGPLVHVATSARDVRGALEAGIPTVRLVRPRHELDPDGPSPAHEVSAVSQLVEVLDRL